MSKAYLLQSGFASLTDNGFNLEIGEDISFRKQILNENFDLSKAEYYYHPVITNMVKEYMANYKVIDTFAFRDKLLRTTLLCFSCRSIKDWLRAQRLSPYMADLQKAFLTETLNFVCGLPRSMSPVQWAKLLDTEVSNQNVQCDFDDMFTKTHAPHPVPEDMHTFIRTWVTKENGYEDMLISMWLIFGRRTVIKTLNYSRNVRGITDAHGMVNPVGGM